jgi:NADH:ubiquinone oxidoreductase subunit F (NADH-binding)/NADH:ubiquinone oxidoreductase subunit E
MTKKAESGILKLSKQYPEKDSVMLPALDMVQRENDNYLTHDAINSVASLLNTSKSRTFGIATYYTMYNKKHVGTYHLQVDTNIPGLLTGSLEILEFLKSTLGIEEGETTTDGLFTLSHVEDLASCGTCPVIQVNDTYYENMTIEKTEALVASLKQGNMPQPDKNANYGTECGILLKNRGNPRAREIEEYRRGGGYQALAKALAMTGAQIISEVKDCMLRGRGGAGFPTGLKWSFLPKDDPRPVYLVCNADEGEPGTFKDRQIMEYDPHLLVEGVAISAHALGAKKAFIYIRGEFRWIAEILTRAIEQADKAGHLKHVDIIVHSGAGSYVCGDETALMESIEGKRGHPRSKPPFPANIGLYGCPTIINNVETLACIPYIVENGADAFKKIGSVGNSGPKLYGVSGHVNKPGVYEYPMGTPLETILSAAGGVKGTLKAVIVGGLSVPVLKADEIAGLSMDFDNCVKAGTMLGSGGIMVINDTVSIPRLALRTIQFYAHESCGQCTPCREGSYAVMDLLKKVLSKRGERTDIDRIEKMCRTIPGLTLCPTGDAFAIPVGAMIKKFRAEFEALIGK